MATYVTLVGLTDDGARTVKDTTKRAAAVTKMAKNFGAELVQLYWTFGQYDLVGIVNAPDDESAMAFAAAVSATGTVRVQTLRAFDSAEMDQILAKLP